MDKNIEFEEMRRQLAALKQQLAKQTIINENIMRRATAEKASKLRRKRNNILALGMIGIFFSVPTFAIFGFPAYFVAYTLFICLFSMAKTVAYHNRVSKSDFMNGDLKSAAQELKKLRTHYNQWYWIGVPLVLIFLLLFYHSLLTMDFGQETAKPIIIGGTIGFIIGACIGVYMNRNVVRLCDDIIKDIEAI